MDERKKIKKASDEQKEFLLNYMEENSEFAHDRFESSDGAHLKAAKWSILAAKLNSIGGANKDVNQWRKYWRDQKLHAKEREALIKASFQRSGVNGLKKIKQLNPFENRIVAMLAPAAVSDADVPELFNTPQAQADMSTTPSQPSPSPSPSPSQEKETARGMEIVLASDVASEMGLVIVPEVITEVAGSTSAAAPRPTPRKRKHAASGNSREVSSFEEKMLKIEEEKLMYVKKTYKMKEKFCNWKMEYKEKCLALRVREVSLKEKQLYYKMKNNE